LRPGRRAAVNRGVMRPDLCALAMCALVSASGCATETTSKNVQYHNPTVQWCSELLPQSTQWAAVRVPPTDVARALTNSLHEPAQSGRPSSTATTLWWSTSDQAQFAACTVNGAGCNQLVAIYEVDRVTTPSGSLARSGKSNAEWLVTPGNMSLATCSEKPPSDKP